MLEVEDEGDSHPTNNTLSLTTDISIEVCSTCALHHIGWQKRRLKLLHFIALWALLHVHISNPEVVIKICEQGWTNMTVIKPRDWDYDPTSLQVVHLRMYVVLWIRVLSLAFSMASVGEVSFWLSVSCCSAFSEVLHKVDLGMKS